jgi:lysyl-tRNA synthetase class 2
VIRLHRHRLGPRVYVLGRRIHEWQVGIGMVGLIFVGHAAGAWRLSTATVLAAAVGGWFVVKDWRDVLPGTRDRSSWRLGLHRRAAPLRETRRADGLPAVAGAVAFTIGLVNLASALTPDIAWRHHLLLELEPVEAVPLFHTLTVPASLALVVTAFYLRERRQRAWRIAVLLMLVLGALALLKGLDFEEALLSWAAAGVLWWGRAAFCVRHDPLRPRTLLGATGALAAGSLLAGTVVWVATRSGPGEAVRELGDLLAWTKGPVSFGDGLAWIPLAVGILGVTGVAVLASVVFRPLRAPAAAGEAERQAARDLVRTHGRDTLAFFKLRLDARYLFSSDRRAFLGYRVANGVLVVSGDPVGSPDAVPGLLTDACAFAEQRGLRLAVVGASGAMLPLYARAGLRSLYIGDEAVVDTACFSLDGRAVRKVRQSVSRMQTAGFQAEVHELSALDEDALCELEQISSLWRAGAPERGFSMAMDSVRGTHQAGSLVVVARDRDGAIRGFLHFVPTYGTPAMSLSFMRRDRTTPNGLMEFLVVRSIELLRERGVQELSLNFAAFGRWLRRPAGRLERLLGLGIALANPFFQIESLYRFNAKFTPRWEPRYLVHEGAASLPRVALAALRIEGQVPSRSR